MGREVGRDWGQSPRDPERTGMGLVQLRLSIALACAIAGCAQNVVPEALPLPTPWAVDITQNDHEPPPIDKAQSVPEPPPVDKAQNVIPEPTPRPDYKGAIALDCSGLLHGWNNCLITASNTCGSKSYTVVDRSDQYPPGPEDSTFTRSMRIRCNS
jgi:hypothetical protein